MNGFYKDIRATLALGVPMVFAQICLMAMTLTDTIMVGRGAGTEALAAMALALGCLNVPAVALSGFAGITSVLVAGAYGSGKTSEMPSILRHAMAASVVVTAIIMGGACLLFDHLEWFGLLGQPQHVVNAARPFAHLYSLAVICYTAASNFRAYCEAQNRPWISLGVVFATIFVNGFLDWIFVFGRLGVPAMGLVGAGLATLTSSFLELLALGAIVLKIRSLNLPARQLFRFDFARAQIVRFMKLGAATSAQIGIEMVSYAVLALIAGRFGAATLAAYHVTFQVASLAFMVPLGLSFAVAIRVSQASCAGDRVAVRRICASSLAFALAWMSVSMIAILTLHNFIPRLFTHDPAVVALASTFLIVAGIFQLFDGVQCTSIGALRGLRDVYRPTLLVIAIYWLCEIPLAFALALWTRLGGLGVWLAMMTALMLSAACLSARLMRITAVQKHAE